MFIQSWYKFSIGIDVPPDSGLPKLSWEVSLLGLGIASSAHCTHFLLQYGHKRLPFRCLLIWGLYIGFYRGYIGIMEKKMDTTIIRELQSKLLVSPSTHPL